jgi:hypothetical protein
LQGRDRVSREHRVGQYLEEVGVGPSHALPGLGLVPSNPAAGTGQPGDGLHVRKVERELGGRGARGGIGGGGLLARCEYVRLQPVDVLIAGDEPLEAIFVADVEPDQNRCGETRGQSEDGDAGIKPVAREIAEGGDEVIAQHVQSVGVAGLAAVCRNARRKESERTKSRGVGSR